MSTRAALALGANLGDRLAYLTAAVSELVDSSVRVVAASSVYETEPVGGPEQGAYLNAVIVIDSDVTATELLERAHRAESSAGRLRGERWGPRTLDVDVLAFGAETSLDPALTLPHPRAHERAFVLVPWAEIDPDYVLPSLGRTVGEILAELPPAELSGVRLAHLAPALIGGVSS